MPRPRRIEGSLTLTLTLTLTVTAAGALARLRGIEKNL
jgi:hypothetical protein